jgi:hypothetical protein
MSNHLEIMLFPVAIKSEILRDESDRRRVSPVQSWARHGGAYLQSQPPSGGGVGRRIVV